MKNWWMKAFCVCEYVLVKTFLVFGRFDAEGPYLCLKTAIVTKRSAGGLGTPTYLHCLWKSQCWVPWISWLLCEVSVFISSFYLGNVGKLYKEIEENSPWQTASQAGFFILRPTYCSLEHKTQMTLMKAHINMASMCGSKSFFKIIKL